MKFDLEQKTRYLEFHGFSDHKSNLGRTKKKQYIVPWQLNENKSEEFKGE